MKKHIGLKSRMLLGASALACFALGTGISASAAQDQDDDSEEIEEVVVTGSRIARADLAAVAPVQVIGSEAIEFSAEVNIGELLNQLPAAGSAALNRTNSSFSTANGGLTTVDLRNLGTARTLILQNGRRIVAGVPGSSAVDLNNIPTALIDSVQVITGGGSAVYGSDAIGGVVNFVMKDDFEGLQIDARFDAAEVTGGNERNIDITSGGNFGDGRGNAVVHFNYSEQDAIFSRNVERTATDQLSAIFFGGEPFDVVSPFFSSFPPQGRFDAGGGFANNFTFEGGELVQGFDTNGASGPANGFNRSNFRTIAIPVERFNASAFINYEINDYMNFFGEMTYSRTEIDVQIEPFPLSGDDIFPGTGGLPLEYENSNGDLIRNPFLPVAIGDEAVANGRDFVGFVRRLAEFGPRRSSDTRNFFRAVVGLEGEVGALRYDLSFNYGSTTQGQISPGRVDTSAFREAMLSERLPDGTVQCVNPEARAQGCVPVNIFGEGQISAAAVQYIEAATTRNARVEQNIIQGNVTGPLFELPAGDLQFAAGFEYREEESAVINDALTARGLGSGNALPSVAGEFDVIEGYLEVDVPILKDTFVDYLGVSGAIRVSDYSSVGTTETYQARIELKLIEDIAFRATWSEAVRAPNITELFNPGGETFATVQDPCNNLYAESDSRNEVTGNVRANCLADATVANRFSTEGFFVLTQPELQGTGGFVGGNPTVADPNAAPLFEETAETWTVGMVFTPTFLPDGMSFDATVDYYRISVDDAISTLSRQQVLNQCFNDPAGNLSNNFCANVIRFPQGNIQQGALDRVNSGNANIAGFFNEGIDVSGNFSLDADMIGLNTGGQFFVQGVYTYLMESTVEPLPGADLDIEDGEILDPKHRFNINIGYRQENFSVQWQTRYIGRGRIDDQFLSIADCQGIDCFVDPQVYNDVQLRYTLPGSLVGNSEIELYGGVENVFDNEAPLVPIGLPESDTGTETAASIYDAVGRSFYIGIRARF